MSDRRGPTPPRELGLQPGPSTLVGEAPLGTVELDGFESSQRRNTGRRPLESTPAAFASQRAALVSVSRAEAFAA